MYWDRTEVGKFYSDFLALHSFASHVFCVCVSGCIYHSYILYWYGRPQRQFGLTSTERHALKRYTSVPRHGNDKADGDLYIIRWCQALARDTWYAITPALEHNQIRRAPRFWYYSMFKYYTHKFTCSWKSP